MAVRLPPGCGALLEESLLYSEYQQRFARARRLRFCLACRRASVPAPDCVSSMDEMGRFTCPRCHTEANGRYGNLLAPRAFNRFLLLSGRGGGKTLIGAHAVREELMIPEAVWWVMSDTYKRLHDSTFPTLTGLLHPKWIKRWDAENMEITLLNNAMVAFRSLEDPDRARGPHGVNGMWFDEAALCPVRSWHVGTPMLIKAGGIALATTTVLGYDWTYEELEQRALIYHEPGYWTAKWKTLDNPLFRTNPVMRAEIERSRRLMPPQLFAQEYESERSNAQGLIFDYATELAPNWLPDDAAVQAYIEEWPRISPSRQILVGIDEGSDHPFGVVLIVVTPRELVLVGDWLERMKATSAAHDAVFAHFGLGMFANKTLAGNKNALNLRLEWGLKGTGVVPAESKREVGLQRLHSWLLSGQFKVAYTAKRTFEQFRAYRYKTQERPGGEKPANEQVFKLKDELVDGSRYAVMAYPTLPEPAAPPIPEAEQRRLAAFDEKTRRELDMLKDLAERRRKGNVLEPADEGYPTGDFFQHEGGGRDDEIADFSFMYQ